MFFIMEDNMSAESTNNKTINYYNHNAQAFIADTVSVEFNDQQEMLLKYLKPGAHILDLGCGAGRDSKSFIEKGYKITALDGSAELCKIASDYIGQEVICKTFEELDDNNTYDAVWACASLLHVPMKELPSVIASIERALKPGGYLYTSFKYGDFEGERKGRYFTNLTEGRLRKIVDRFDSLDIIEMTLSLDVREDREDEKWLNVIIKKL